MALHNEIEFEKEICEHLGGHGWIYKHPVAQDYEREKAIYTPDLIAWVQEAWPDAWESLQSKFGSRAQDQLLSAVRRELDQKGTLEVIRGGVAVFGLRSDLKLAEFKPALGLNEEILKRYKANRLRVARQIKYSLHNENCIDLVLFLNGIPVATVELKTDNTQSIDDAVYQYKKDRQPKPAGQKPEPLLSFPSGALVHFAVSNREVQMATKLEGFKTFFLPFNKGSDPGGKNCGKGNPLSDGHQTAYLWEEVWERESWLEILGRYLTAERNKKNEIHRVLFPRFHQLRVTRKLVAAVKAEGPGQKYLIQHSAGSGKTNSIAWTAHFFSELHDEENKKIFDSVIVVSDRNVIDTQLQEALEAFERRKGVVASISRSGGSKSEQLADALSGDKKVVVCTIQTFPFALEAVHKLAATEGKRFAVIADEAHSSQTGEAASKLKQVLSAEEIAEMEDGGEISTDDILAAEMANRAKESGITYVAFTATPKAKTLELFGRRPNPNEPAFGENLPEPFDVYSMRQAIEEGFILDVLQNYTTYKLAFKLAQQGQELSESEVERNAAQKKLMGWVKLHAYNIAQKVEIIVEHFREFVWPELDNKAKAMVVVGSRKEAVRWKLAIDKYIADKGYTIGTLAAFSGEVNDRESGPDPFTEKSSNLNQGLNGRDIREAFQGDDRQILLVANKFQTGFDQPKLCGMYVDRRLAGIQAVQTLSRLNRCHPNKDTTFVVDFANEANDILAAFKTYYATAELAEATDPNLILELKAKLDAQNHYDDFEIDRVVEVLMDPKSKQSQLHSALEPVAQRLMTAFKEARTKFKTADDFNDEDVKQEAKEEMDSLTLFRSDMGTYVRFYTFLSQVFNYENTDYEKRGMFFKRLLPLLEFERDIPEIDLSKVVLTHHHLKNQGLKKLDLTEGEVIPIPGMKPGGGAVQDKDKVLLSEIIEKLNELFTGELTDDDKVMYAQVIQNKLLGSKTLQQQAANNSKEQFKTSPDLLTSSMDAYIEALDAHQSMSKQALDNPYVRAQMMELLIEKFGLWEALRDRAAS
ncbi:type I restriction endonuclease subunit R [Synechococcus sp. A10-1-5-9]|uniref:type I restriction endonuclease subunit R n=1 Tax=Synechococcus sp. A10-1-5-9 TaxID=3392295 RepID=UPI0039EAEFBD